MIYLIKYVFQIKQDLKLSVFNMITGITESKTLTKNMSCKCKCKLNVTKCNSDQRWNNDKCRCECRKTHVCAKYYVWSPATCNCENGKYLAIIMDDSAIISELYVISHRVIRWRNKKLFPQILMKKI